VRQLTFGPVCGVENQLQLKEEEEEEFKLI